MTAFQQVIDRVKSGAADPDQLALSSLGQQARIHLWLGGERTCRADELKAAKDKSAAPLARAQAYYRAANLLRAQGLEFTGYEMTPDYAIYGAGYN